MIFNLHPLFGLLPLLMYIVMLLSKKKIDLLAATFCTVVFGAILTGQTLQSFGAALVGGMGGFLAVIGFIVILGAGLGRVLLNTGVAQTLVQFLLNTIGIKTQTRAIIAIMLTSSLLTAMLGTSNGAIAIIAPIVIPVAASLGFSKSSIGVLLHGSAATGLFLGPFTPPTVTTLGLSGISYGTYMINAGIPISVLIWIVTFIMVQYTQKKTVGDPANLYTTDDYDTTKEFVSTKESKRGTVAFCLTVLSLVVYGIIMQAGATFAVVIIILSGIAVLVSTGTNANDYVTWTLEGSASLLRIFFAFVLCGPMVQFITETGAFAAVGEILLPVAQVAGPVSFAMIVAFVGVFGITGAAVAQQQIIHEMFLPTVMLLAFPMEIWAIILLVGSQITSFVIPGGDIYVPMSLARSTDVKSMLRNGYCIAAVTMGYVIVRAFFI